MAKTKISEFSATPANNTDIDSINIAEGCSPSGINDAIRELMAQLKDFQTGAVGDSFNGPVGTTTAAAGAFTTLSASSTVSGTGFSTYLASPPAIGGTAAAAGSFTTLSASGNVTLSGGTANGVAYLNGSKVVTSGSALVFDGTNKLTVGDTNNGNFVLGLTTAYQGKIGYDASGNTTLTFENTYSNASAAQVWKTNGSEQMRLTSTGLGIGTSSPSSKLDVQTSGVGIQLKQDTAGAATYYVMENTVETGGKRWRFGYTGAAGIPTFSLYNQTDNVTAWVADASGNLGLGVTPSASATYKAMQIGTAGVTLMGGTAGVASFANMGNNFYFDGSVYRYVATAASSRVNFSNGAAEFYTAPSGTAGNAITFTQALTLNASGNLILGGTTERSSAKFTVDFSGGSNNGLVLNNVSGGGSPAHISFQFSSSAVGSVTCTNTTTTYNITSDQRLKNDLGAVTTTDVIANTVIHDFTWKSDGSKSRGVFAQEAAKTLPSAVKVGDDGEEVTDQWQVDYSKYVPDIIVELQALRARVAELEAK